MAEQFAGVESIAQIDTDNLRGVLRATMVMGLPEDDEEKPTFVFERAVDWTKHDSEDKPWDWTEAPVVETQTPDAQVICAYEFFSPLGRQGAFTTEVGDFNPTTLIFTMFEDEFDEVSGFSHATIGPSDKRWYFRFWRPSVGLSNMTVYQVQCVAEGTE